VDHQRLRKQEGTTTVRSEEVSFYSGGCTIAGTFTEAADPWLPRS